MTGWLRNRAEDGTRDEDDDDDDEGDDDDDDDRGVDVKQEEEKGSKPEKRSQNGYDAAFLITLDSIAGAEEHNGRKRKNGDKEESTVEGKSFVREIKRTIEGKKDRILEKKGKD